MTSSQVEVELEAEWQQLKKDRDTLRTTFPKGNNRVGNGNFCMIVYLYCPRTLNVLQCRYYALNAVQTRVYVPDQFTADW
jgi:hypothetical protein